VIDALIAGRIFGTPEQRTARNGSPFVTAKARIPTANGEVQFVNIVAFRESARTALLALEDGDSVALAGELKFTAYIGKDGLPHPGVDLSVHQVLTEYHVARKRKAVAATREPQAKPAPRDPDDFADEVPF